MPGGRPRSEMTDEVCEAILRTVRLGLHAERAAQAHGVNVGTYRAHKRRHSEFASALKKAEAEAEQSYLSRILLHTEKQWTACAWLLERRWPERWAKREPDAPRMSKRELQEAMVAAADAVREVGGA